MSTATTVRLPKLDQDMTEGHILEWLVQDGAEVDAGAPICVIETDKVSTELVAEGSGVVHIVVEAGQTAPIGAVLAVVGGEGGMGSPPERGELDRTRDEVAGPEPVGNPARVAFPEGAAPHARAAPPPVETVVVTRESDVSITLPVNRRGWARPHAVSPRRRIGDGSAQPVGASTPPASGAPAMELASSIDVMQGPAHGAVVEQFPVSRLGSGRASGYGRERCTRTGSGPRFTHACPHQGCCSDLA